MDIHLPHNGMCSLCLQLLLLHVGKVFLRLLKWLFRMELLGWTIYLSIAFTQVYLTMRMILKILLSAESDSRLKQKKSSDVNFDDFVEGGLNKIMLCSGRFALLASLLLFAKNFKLILWLLCSSASTYLPLLLPKCFYCFYWKTV